MGKRTITQRQFRAMELHETFLERKDLDLRATGLRTALNARVLTSGGIEARPGTDFLFNSAAKVVMESYFPNGDIVAIMIGDSFVRVITEALTVQFEETTVPWTDAKSCYLQEIDSGVLIGYPGGFRLLRRSRVTSGAWVFETPEVDAFWNFSPGSTLNPSDDEGSMTLVCSRNMFKTSHVGTTIRYGSTKINITGYTSPNTVTGTSDGAVPPSWEITVASGDGFKVGEVVTGQDSGWLGYVQFVGATTIRAITIESFEGPDPSERLSGPNTTTTISAVSQINPLPSPLWDESLMSAARGFPTSSEYASGRLFLCGFPEAPNVIAVSAVDSPFNFITGTSDSDGIVRTIGNDTPRLRHVVAASDLLFFSDRGIYVQELRGETVLSPSTFAPFQVDLRGSSTIEPARVADGVVFVESNERTISAAVLDGNVYLKWSVIPISLFHSQRDKQPVQLCGPSLRSNEAEKYLFIVNSDGTMGCMAWDQGFQQDVAGISPWITDGNYLYAAPLFGGYWFVVARPYNSQNFFERMNYSALLDSMLIGNPRTAAIVPHLAGAEVSVASGQRWVGNGEVDEMGNISQGEALLFPDGVDGSQIGLPFTTEIGFWPVEVIEAPHTGLVNSRVVMIGVSVQHTGEFEIYANAKSRLVGGYVVGESLSFPPALVERRYKAPVTGRPPHAVVGVRKARPGRFRLLSATQEVTY